VLARLDITRDPDSDGAIEGRPAAEGRPEQAGAHPPAAGL
jgi:hypothetical protein